MAKHFEYLISDTSLTVGRRHDQNNIEAPSTP